MALAKGSGVGGPIARWYPANTSDPRSACPSPFGSRQCRDYSSARGPRRRDALWAGWHAEITSRPSQPAQPAAREGGPAFRGRVGPEVAGVGEGSEWGFLPLFSCRAKHYYSGPPYLSAHRVVGANQIAVNAVAGSLNVTAGPGWAGGPTSPLAAGRRRQEGSPRRAERSPSNMRLCVGPSGVQQAAHAAHAAGLAYVALGTNSALR